MGRYRRVEQRMWSDARFQALSEGAKLLWCRLLTGPETTSLPGLVVAGRMQLSEAMGWSAERFDELFREITDNGMARADWRARVIWVPNGVKYNKPDNPNVVAGWADHWENVPECPLKDEASRALRASLERLGERFVERFQKLLHEPCAKGMANQEQEQEQEQDPGGGDGSASPPLFDSSPPSPTPKLDPLEGFDAFYAAYPRKKKRPDAERAWRKLKPDALLRAEIAAGLERAKRSRQWSDRTYVPYPASFLNGRQWQDEWDCGAADQAPSGERGGYSDREYFECGRCAEGAHDCPPDVFHARAQEPA